MLVANCRDLLNGRLNKEESGSLTGIRDLFLVELLLLLLLLRIRSETIR